MKRTFTTLLTLALGISACGNVPPIGGAGGAGGSPADAAAPLAFPVTGVGMISGEAGTIAVNLAGTLIVDRFSNQNGQLVAVGTLRGSISNAAGSILGIFAPMPVALPIVTAHGTCEVLGLELGPLRVNVLGLVVDLSAIHLDITAEPGTANQVGNLLCAIADVLDRGGTLDTITGLLSDLLRALDSSR
ncbi:MAG TPA: hypothetical protein VK524_33095 [Polyangiaceae bacterium]|nr:hypothetical protein [Polyangiaceae bacterium]